MFTEKLASMKARYAKKYFQIRLSTAAYVSEVLFGLSILENGCINPRKNVKGFSIEVSLPRAVSRLALDWKDQCLVAENN